MLTYDAAWAIGDVPTPELIGLRYRKTARPVVLSLRFRSAPMRQLIGGFQDAVETGF